MGTVVSELFNNPKNYFGIAALMYELLLCVFVMVKFNKNRQSKRFRIFAFIVTGATFFEILRPAVGALPDTTLNYYIKCAAQSLNYVGSTGMAFAFTWYLDSFFKSSTRLRFAMRKINFILYLVFIAVCVVNVWTGWIAGYDTETGIFTHGPVYLAVGYGVAIYFLLYVLVFFIRDIRKLDRRVVHTMVASILIAVLSVCAQPLLHDKVRLMVFGVSLSVYLWYFSIENFDTQRLLSMTKKLQAAEQKALEASLAKNAFLANMSHEIRTPLNAVLGLDEMILKSDDKAEVDEYARTIQGAGKTLLSLINDILDFSKIETGRLEFVVEPYRLGPLLDDMNQMMSVRASQKNLDYRVKIDGTLPDRLVGDEMRVRQIVMNLVNNAIKYTEKGFVQLTVTGVPKGESVMLRISIADSGVGIREEDKKNLFKSFERLDETRHHSVEGAGLGLAIVHQLLDLMGGEIKVESEYGKGSVFTVYLPQEIGGPESIEAMRARDSHAEAEAEAAEHVNVTAPGAKVLVVDDNRVNLMVAKGLLKDTEVQVTTCESGKSCLELMRTTRFDIIFLDHMMPEMDGMETFRRSQEMEGNLNKDVPVVVFTANAMAGMKEQYLAVGFSDYISKPIDSARFKAVLFRNLPPHLLQRAHEKALPADTGLEELVPESDGPFFIDQKSGMELCGGTMDVYRSVLSLFIEEKSANREKLDTFAASGDWKNYGILAHALKSNSKLVGCPEFSDFALRMERSCDEGTDYARQNHAEFLAGLDRLEDSIRTLLSSLPE